MVSHLQEYDEKSCYHTEEKNGLQQNLFSSIFHGCFSKAFQVLSLEKATQIADYVHGTEVHSVTVLETPC